jgi:glycosyltransferase involved in cell wall biosynthesis
MRILCVINGAVAGGDGALRVFHHDGDFLLELRRYVGDVTLAQPLFDVGRLADDAHATFCDFDLARHPQVRVSVLPWSAGGPLARAVSYLRAIPWILRETRRADFLYLFLPGHLPLLFSWSARLLRRPYGVYLRSAIDIDTRRMANALAGARFVLATTAHVAGRARERCARSDVVTPMMGLRLGDLVEHPRISETAPWRILFVGRIEAAKGVQELLQGLGALRRRGVAFTLELAGAGADIERYRERAAQEGLADAVFHGMVSDPERLRALFRAADLLVLPTYNEGFPRVLYEAMTHGVPVVTTFVGGIPSVMRDGENCVRIEARDAADLSATVEKVLADPALRRRVAEGAIATMREILEPERPSHARQVAERLPAPGRCDPGRRRRYEDRSSPP